MNRTSTVQQTKADNSLLPVRGALQRKCACGNHTSADKQCNKCSTERGTSLQRSVVSTQSVNGVSSNEPGMQLSGSDGIRIDKSNKKSSRPLISNVFPLSDRRPTGRLKHMNEQAGNVSSLDKGFDMNKVSVIPKENTAVSSEEPEERTATTGVASGNSIDLTFNPATTTPTPDCDRIVMLQSIQMTADGSPIKPGTYYTPWTCRDPAALSDGTYIDHDCTCTTPYYTDCFNGTAGVSNATSTSAATIFDAPQTGGGTKGFRSVSNPTGWRTVLYKFKTYGFCAAGNNCPNFYEGVDWTYRKTDADHAAGNNGTSTVGSSLAVPLGPSSPIHQAFYHFNSVKGFTPC